MKKLHKITGIVLALVVIWMGISGVILNHRQFFSGVDVGRNYVPESYRYNDWNYGFFKASLKLSADTVFMYGNEGIWLSDQDNTHLTECNNGIYPGSDNLKISGMVLTPANEILAAGMYHLYSFDRQHNQWITQKLPDSIDRITDMEIKGDTLVVLTRSEVLVKNILTENAFRKMELNPSPDRTGKRSLFRVIWKLHSGELFGLAGKIVVDLFAILLAFFSITGIMMWLFPKYIKRRKKQHKPVKLPVSTFRFSWKWHIKLGFWLAFPLLILVISGTFLRPPLLIAVAKTEITPPPFITMSSENTWHDQLRVIRYDELRQEWLLYTSDGFFTLKKLTDSPRKASSQPPVSVMGVNVLQQLDEDCWVVGSFSGLVVWNRTSGSSIDGFTGMPARAVTGMPFGQRKISGFTSDFAERTIVFDYDRGVHIFEPDKTFTAMPQTYGVRPMSFWNLALEMHTGRVFTFLGVGNVLFVFVVGVTAVLMIFSGWWRARKK